MNAYPSRYLADLSDEPQEITFLPLKNNRKNKTCIQSLSAWDKSRYGGKLYRVRLSLMKRHPFVASWFACLFILLPVLRVFDPAIPHSLPQRFVLHGCYQTRSWASCLPIKCTIHFVDSTKDCVLFSLRHHFHIGSGTRLSTTAVRDWSMQIAIHHLVISRLRMCGTVPPFSMAVIIIIIIIYIFIQGGTRKTGPPSRRPTWA